MLEKETKDKQAPSLEFTAQIEIDAKEFKDFVDDASVAGDALNFVADGDILKLTAGDTGSKVSIELSKASDSIVSMEVKERSSSIYSVEYLKKMGKAAVLSDTAMFQFSSDYPLRIDFKSINNLQMSFVLAPRIENK